MVKHKARAMNSSSSFHAGRVPGIRGKLAGKVGRVGRKVILENGLSIFMVPHATLGTQVKPIFERQTNL